MQNRSIILLLVLFLTISVTACTRITSVEEVDVEGGNAAPAEAAGKRKTSADVLPMENMPDVKIDPSAEIPSDEAITNVKVPDVKIDATEGLGNIDETRVDGMDNIVDEP